MRNSVARVAGPTLLVGSVVAVWIGVGLGTLSTPQTTQAATTRAVVVAPPFRPNTASVLAVKRLGDRVLLRVRSGSTTADLEVSPGLRAVGTSLVSLAEATSAGRQVQVRLEYGTDGAVGSLIRT